MKRATLIQFDIETLSLHPTNAVVAEIGAHVLHLHTASDGRVMVGASDSISVLFDMEEQQMNGRRIDIEIIQWWLGQNRDARMRMSQRQGRVKLQTGMFKIDGFVREHIRQAELDGSMVYILSSSTFDLTNIKTMYAQSGMDEPWLHHQEHNQRTLRWLCNHNKLPERTTGTPHSGEEDAKWQNHTLLHILNMEDDVACYALRQFFNLNKE